MHIALIRKIHPLPFALASISLVAMIASAAQAQGLKQDAAVASDKPVVALKSKNSAPTPKFSDYRGVHIGMSADEARQKLGEPKDKDKTEDLYVLSDNESAQVYYDEKGSVYAISVDYSDKNGPAPTPTDIFGEDVTPKADGSIYQMQPYPEAGYWVSYNKTKGASSVITVTIQKIQ